MQIGGRGQDVVDSGVYGAGESWAIKGGVVSGKQVIGGGESWAIKGGAVSGKYCSWQEVKRAVTLGGCG